MRETGWTILDYNLVTCWIVTPNTPDEDCRGERCTNSTDDPSDGPVLQGCSPECGSPIVVDLDCGGFSFTAAEDGVRFDIDGDGSKERIAWLDRAGGDVLLVLDRNGNGLIDDGTELFGNWTPQPATAEPNGFIALAVFDSPGEGGNGDGIISREDVIYDALRLWKDNDHDGVSQAEELTTLASGNVRGIELSYITAQRRDRHGNYLRWMSKVYFGGERRMAAVDVIFRTAE